jgi:hypothetical protein
MSMPRYAAKRDDNEPELVEYARAIGWFLHKLDEPCDWLGLWRGAWSPIEIKSATGDLTPKQHMFHADAKKRNGRVLMWRSKDDVDRDSGARRTA